MSMCGDCLFFAMRPDGEPTCMHNIRHYISGGICGSYVEKRPI